MGSIKIMLKDGAFFFMNNFGDGIFNVYVCEEKDVPKHMKTECEFKGHFTIFTKGWLMYSDCDNEQKQHEFDKGRYFVDLAPDGTTFYIHKQDTDIHA